MRTARRILKELADPAHRRAILTAFWKHADPTMRAVATAHLARALHFREETLRRMPAGKRADLLASRIGAAEFEEVFEAALMQYHTHGQNEMMSAFLDRWQVPHTSGSIEGDDYTPPTAEQVRGAVKELEGSFDRRDIAIYLAAAGLLMSGEWRDATWPVVDEMAGV